MSIAYAVEIDRVREVSLFGTACADFWLEKLTAEELQPITDQGKARILVNATDAKFKGIRFQEFSCSIFVRDLRQDRDGVFLIQAFNSRRFFAFVERTVFHTPYYPARIEVRTQPQLAIELARKQILFSAMHDISPRNLPPVHTLYERLELPIFLPTAPGTTKRLFYGKLEGETCVYPFIQSQDQLLISPAPNLPIFEWLRQSEFSGQEWRLREAAIHSKSKTLPRD